MTLDLIFGLVGGLGFFFFGMKTMSDGLKKIAGDRLRDFLGIITKHRVYGILVGTFLTILVQSSSVTTVMVVGFVNAGLLGLKQAITVVMGANIGTTFTAWLVSFMSVFKITKYALPLIGIGYALMSLPKKKKHQDLGQVILGFGVLFIGLGYMKDAFGPLKESPVLHDIFTAFSVNPILGILAGIIFTILLQSSSATITIVQVLAFNGVISFEAAVPIILGDNIGTTITAQMAAMGANINARRAAMSHTIFNVVGVAYMTVFVQMGLFSQAINFIIPGELSSENVMFYIAVAHSSFNVFNTLLFLPFVSFLKDVSCWLVPQKGESVDFGTQYLEEHLLDTPTLALEQIHKENEYMLSVARKAVRSAVNGFFDHDMKGIKKAIEYEDLTDNLQSEITKYIIKLSQRDLRKDESKEIPILIHNVNDMERIGDYAQNLAEISKRAMNEDLQINAETVNEIKSMWAEVELMFEDTQQALADQDKGKIESVFNREKIVDDLQEKFKQSHINRLHSKDLNLNTEFLFLEYVDNLEKVADRLTNVAEGLIKRMNWKISQVE